MTQRQRMQGITVALDRLEAAIRFGDPERIGHYRAKVLELAADSYLHGVETEKRAWDFLRTAHAD